MTIDDNGPRGGTKCHDRGSKGADDRSVSVPVHYGWIPRVGAVITMFLGPVIDAEPSRAEPIKGRRRSSDGRIRDTDLLCNN